MASRKAKKAAEKQEDTAALFLARMKDAAQKKLADNPHVHFQDTAKFFDSIYGIPLTGNLILQYLLGVDVLALGRCLTLVGEPGAHKSEFGWYLAKLMARAGGLVQFIDTENKSNTDQIDAVFQDHELFLSNVNPIVCTTLDAMLASQARFCIEYEKMGPVFPMMIFVDSLNGVTSEASYDKRIKEDDAATNTAGMRNAGSIQEEMKRFVPRHIARNPILLVVTNHMKEKVDMGGVQQMGAPKQFGEPGGGHKEFMYTWKLQLRRGELLHHAASDSSKVYMKVAKSALGKLRPANIGVPVISHYDETGKESIDFDWDTPLAELLGNDKVIAKTLLAEVMHFVKDGNKYSSKDLGLKEVSAREMGMAIHANAELTEKLQKHVLRIRIKRKWGVDVKSAAEGGDQSAGIEHADEVGEAEDDETEEMPTLDAAGEADGKPA